MIHLAILILDFAGRRATFSSSRKSGVRTHRIFITPKGSDVAALADKGVTFSQQYAWCHHFWMINSDYFWFYSVARCR